MTWHNTHPLATDFNLREAVQHQAYPPMDFRSVGNHHRKRGATHGIDERRYIETPRCGRRHRCRSPQSFFPPPKVDSRR